jgi:hypothetical protein
MVEEPLTRAGARRMPAVPADAPSLVGARENLAARSTRDSAGFEVSRCGTASWVLTGALFVIDESLPESHRGRPQFLQRNCANG